MIKQTVSSHTDIRSVEELHILSCIHGSFSLQSSRKRMLLFHFLIICCLKPWPDFQPLTVITAQLEKAALHLFFSFCCSESFVSQVVKIPRKLPLVLKTQTQHTSCWRWEAVGRTRWSAAPCSLDGGVSASYIYIYIYSIMCPETETSALSGLFSTSPLLHFTVELMDVNK